MVRLNYSDDARLPAVMRPVMTILKTVKNQIPCGIHEEPLDFDTLSAGIKEISVRMRMARRFEQIRLQFLVKRKGS